MTVIGLGTMGSALARSLLTGGRRVTVWNRTPARVAPIVAAGGESADSAFEAMAASPMTIVCLVGYDAMKQSLDAPAGALAGRTLVQLSTGTPDEARDAEAWAVPLGLSYLDGAILAFPDDIGKEHCRFVVSGCDDAAFSAVLPDLQLLAPKAQYLGSQVGAAAALDCAILSMYMGAMIGTVHALRVCEVEGSLDAFAMLAEEIAAYIPEDVANLASVVRDEGYADPPATVGTWAAVAARLKKQARDAGINEEFPTLVESLFARAVEAGLTDEDPAALVKFLRG